MKIGVDARNLMGQRTGVGRYLINLLRHFADSPQSHDFYLFSNSVIENLSLPGLHHRTVKGPNLFWKQVILPYEQWKNKCDVLFIPTYSTPIFNPIKTVVTIHDLIFLLYPEWATRNQRNRFSTIVKHSACRADCVIAVSESTRADILKYTGVKNDKVEVVYEGVDEQFRVLNTIDEASFLNRYNLDKPFILFVGSIHPRRNVQRVIESFVQLKVEKKIDHQLVLIGLKQQLDPSISHLIHERNIDQSISMLGFVPDEDLVKFYNLADIFIYPSLYEGFGLPVLEAMACGTPVITSNTSSLPEVAGDAAVLIDPSNQSQMVDAIQNIVENRAWAEELKERGLERCKKFSWKSAAKTTCEIFESVYNS